MNGKVAKLIRKMVYGEMGGHGERAGRKHAVLADSKHKGQHMVCLDPRAIYLAMKNVYKGATDGKQKEKLRAEARLSAKPVPGHRQVHDGLPRFMGDIITVQDPPRPVRTSPAVIPETCPRSGLPGCEVGRETCCFDSNTGTCSPEAHSKPGGEGVGVAGCESDCKCSNAEGCDQAYPVADGCGGDLPSGSLSTLVGTDSEVQPANRPKTV